MSESFESAMAKVNYGKYIDQIQEEIRKAMADVGPGRTPQEVDAIQKRLQDLIRNQAKVLSKEVGFVGNHVMVLMMATSIIATAWVSFTLRREASDMSKSPEDRLGTVEVLDALELALGKVVAAASSYAERYSGAQAAGAQVQHQSESEPRST